MSNEYDGTLLENMKKKLEETKLKWLCAAVAFGLIAFAVGIHYLRAWLFWRAR